MTKAAYLLRGGLIGAMLTCAIFAGVGGALWAQDAAKLAPKM